MFLYYAANIEAHLLENTEHVKKTVTLSGSVAYSGKVSHQWLKRSRVRVPPGRLSSNNLEQVIYTHGAQANSAFHPSGLGKWVAISIW